MTGREVSLLRHRESHRAKAQATRRTRHTSARFSDLCDDGREVSFCVTAKVIARKHKRHAGQDIRAQSIAVFVRQWQIAIQVDLTIPTNGTVRR